MYCILNLAVENNDSVAQLGERYLDRVEVVGSSPIGIIQITKTTLDTKSSVVFV